MADHRLAADMLTEAEVSWFRVWASLLMTDEEDEPDWFGIRVKCSLVLKIDLSFLCGDAIRSGEPHSRAARSNPTACEAPSFDQSRAGKEG